MDQSKQRVQAVTLRLQARAAADKMGHKLNNFTPRKEGGIITWEAACKRCGSVVNIQRHPQADSTVGPALEHTCETVQHWNRELGRSVLSQAGRRVLRENGLDIRLTRDEMGRPQILFVFNKKEGAGTITMTANGSGILVNIDSVPQTCAMIDLCPKATAAGGNFFPQIAVDDGQNGEMVALVQYLPEGARIQMQPGVENLGGDDAPTFGYPGDPPPMD